MIRDGRSYDFAWRWEENRRQVPLADPCSRCGFRHVEGPCLVPRELAPGISSDDRDEAAIMRRALTHSKARYGANPKPVSPPAPKHPWRLKEAASVRLVKAGRLATKPHKKAVWLEQIEDPILSGKCSPASKPAPKS